MYLSSMAPWKETMYTDISMIVDCQGAARKAALMRGAELPQKGDISAAVPFRRARLAALLVLAGAMVMPASAAAKTLSDVTIPASDGVNLVGDVHLPDAGSGRYPAVIDMEPYGRSTSTTYVDQGYAR